MDKKDNKRRKLEIDSLLDEISLGENIPKEEAVIVKSKKSFLDIDIKKKNAMNKTFYLDKDILIKLAKTAKQMNLSESRLINEILKKVLD